MLIGLTGQIGAGKSTVAAILVDAGAVIINADNIGRQVVDQSEELLEQLRQEFGDTIIDQYGQLKRERLAELAFVSEERKAKLNELVHPFLLAELRRQMKLALETTDLVVIDAALLLDWNLDYEMDYTWAVHASESVRIERLKARGMSGSDAVARQKAQLPLSEYRDRADQVLTNDGSLEELQVAVARLLKTIQNENSG